MSVNVQRNLDIEKIGISLWNEPLQYSYKISSCFEAFSKFIYNNRLIFPIEFIATKSHLLCSIHELFKIVN